MVTIATPTTTTTTTAERVRQALHWRDALWDEILEDLAKRDLPAAQTIHDIIAQQPALLYSGRSTRYAMWGWRYLDAQARGDWLWVCECIQKAWIRGTHTPAVA